MRYVVDIDGTICEHFNGPNFGSGKVYYDRIEKINKLITVDKKKSNYIIKICFVHD